MKFPAVYIISNKNRTTLYIGVTNDIERRMLEHKAGLGSVFASKYHLTDLLFYETFQAMVDAIDREKQLKNWHKEWKWKWNLIKRQNSRLKDIARNWFTSDDIDQFRKDMMAIYNAER